MKYEGTTALITGASSGIGSEFARRFASRGASVVLVARRKDRLQDLAAEIRRGSDVAVHIIQADLTAEDAGGLLAERIRDLGISIDSVVNCAGVGRTASFTTSSRSDITQQIATNVEAVVSISHAFLPQLLASRAGALINVASLTGYMPTPGMAVYAASKTFVIRFTEALAYELADSGVRVLAVSPGPTRTEFFKEAGTSTRGVRFQTPQQVVTTVLKTIDKPRAPFSMVSGRFNRLTRRVVGILPTPLVLKLANSASTKDNALQPT